MTIPLALCSFILTFAAQVSAQAGCDGSYISQAANLAADYPPAFTIATLMPGDTEAQDIYQAILATNNPALNIAPSSAPNGNLQMGSYDLGDDPSCWWSATRCTSPKAADVFPDYYFCPQPNTWGYTFDDGPTCDHGPLYEFMAQQNQLASLYYIGTNVIQWPLEAQRGYLAGHEICVHTWSHHYTTSLTNEQVFAELYYTKKLIKQVTGASVRCWRPPYGDVDDRVRVIASALDLRAHIWNFDTDDWEINIQGAAAIASNYANIINQPHSSSGFVVLSHEVNAQTCAMGIQQYPNIQAAFPNIMPVSSCNNDPQIMAEDEQPLLPIFSQYVAGQRGGPRQSSSFWTNDDMLFLNGTAALLENASSSSALPSSTSISQTASTSDGNPASTGTDLQPTIVIGPAEFARSAGVTLQQLSLPAVLVLILFGATALR